MRGIGKRFVYILRSDVDPERHYVCVTSDVEARLDWHNGAVRFEKYLKSGSGRAFAKRHFDTLLGGKSIE